MNLSSLLQIIILYPFGKIKIESEDWNLSLHIPKAWSLLSQESFNAENIFTVNLVLEDNGKGVDDNLYRGMELIVKEMVLYY